MTDPNNAPHVTWSEPLCPAVVAFSTAALERLRQDAVKGLQAIPRIGLGIGGFLTGTHEDGTIRIDGYCPIPCSHAAGPAFKLTPEELEQAVATAPRNEVVGCYLSKTRPPFEPDPELFAALCPEPWQVMLLIHPRAEEKSVVSLAFRDASGAVQQGEERELSEPDGPVEPLEASAEDAGFSAVRIFGLVPSSGKSTRRIVATPSAQKDAASDPDTPYGFHSVLGVKLTGQAATPRTSGPDLPQDSTPEQAPEFAPIRTVRFAGQKRTTVAAPVASDYEVNEPEGPVEPTPMAMPDGPIEFEPARRISLSEKPPEARVRPAEPERLLPDLEGSVAFEPARKSMFVGDEPVYAPRPVPEVADHVDAPPLSPFLEAEPERKPVRDVPQVEAAASDDPHGFASVRSAAFMSQAEKLSTRFNRGESQPSDAPGEPEVVKEPLSPEALARRKLIFRGTGALALTAAVYATRGAWLPTPFKLELADSNSHVTALWNAEILSPGATGTLTVNDGGQTTTVPLDAAKVAGGVIGFDRKTPRVSATLKVGDKTVTATLRVTASL